MKAGLWDLNNTDIQDYKSKGRKVVSIVTHAEYTSDPIDNDIVSELNLISKLLLN